MLHDAIGDQELFIVGLTVSDSVLPKVTVTLDAVNYSTESRCLNTCPSAAVSRTK